MLPTSVYESTQKTEAISMHLAKPVFQERIRWDCGLLAGMGSHEQKCKKSICSSSKKGMFRFHTYSQDIHSSMQLLNKPHFNCSRSNSGRHLLVPHLSQYSHQNQLIVQRVCRIRPLKDNCFDSFI